MKNVLVNNIIIVTLYTVALDIADKSHRMN